MARFFVTGGAGFIGSNLVDSILARGHEVRVFDNLETGSEFFLRQALGSKSFKLIRGDIRNLDEVSESMQMEKPDWVVHLAANADVRFGLERPRRDLDYNTIGTWNVVESARLANCKNILFSSTGSVYGEPEVFPTPEDCPFPQQTSLYGASKLAGEGILHAYAHGFGMNALIFRFVSILGPRYTHGHVFDFVSRLRKNSEALEVLGDGTQTKSYLNVADLIAGLWLAMEQKPSQVRVFNIGHDEALQVKDSVRIITDHMKLKPQIHYTGGKQGWIGDSPRIQLDCRELRQLGWKPQFSLEESVRQTVDYLLEHPFLMEKT